MATSPLGSKADGWESFYSDTFFRQEVRKWRAEDIEQRVLNNAFLLWERYAESNRRFVEERAEQLKSFANLAALVAGFAIVSFLQFDFNVSSMPEGLDLAFGLTMAIVVVLAVNSMSTCGLIHAALMKTGKMYVAESEEAEFMKRCHEFALQYCSGDHPPQPRRDIKSFWLNYCEDEWQRAFFMFSSSVGFFYVNLTLASWIKFSTVQTSAAIMTAVFSSGFVYFLYMHTRWWGPVVKTRSTIYGPNLKDMEAPMGLPFDWHLRPRRFGSFALQQYALEIKER